MLLERTEEDTKTDTETDVENRQFKDEEEDIRLFMARNDIDGCDVLRRTRVAKPTSLHNRFLGLEIDDIDPDEEHVDETDKTEHAKATERNFNRRQRRRLKRETQCSGEVSEANQAQLHDHDYDHNHDYDHDDNCDDDRYHNDSDVEVESYCRYTLALWI